MRQYRLFCFVKQNHTLEAGKYKLALAKNRAAQVQTFPANSCACEEYNFLIVLFPYTF